MAVGVWREKVSLSRCPRKSLAKSGKQGQQKRNPWFSLAFSLFQAVAGQEACLFQKRAFHDKDLLYGQIPSYPESAQNEQLRLRNKKPRTGRGFQDKPLTDL